MQKTKNKLNNLANMSGQHFMDIDVRVVAMLPILVDAPTPGEVREPSRGSQI